MHVAKKTVTWDTISQIFRIVPEVFAQELLHIDNIMH